MSATQFAASHKAKMPSLVAGRKKIWSGVSVLFSLFYFLPYFYFETPQFELGSLLLAYLAFLFAYVLALRSQVPQVIGQLFLVVVVCFIASLLTYGGLFLFAYIAFAIAYHLPFSSQERGVSEQNETPSFVLQSRTWLFFLLLVITFRWSIQDTYSFWLSDTIIEWRFTHLTPIYAAVLMLFCFGFLERRETRFASMNERSREEIEQISTIAERERIGRDLHDIVGHSLSSISLKADLADKLITKGKVDAAQQEMRDIASISRDILSDVRKAVSNIKLRSLHDEVRSLTKLLESKSIMVDSNIDESALQKLTLKSESQLILILKELVTNILRHSNASEVYFSAREKQGTLEVIVHDNGTVSDIQCGNGLSGIKERCGDISANVHFYHDNGFKCELVLALQN
jgi:two-component system sensor histidine kinase DesK